MDIQKIAPLFNLREIEVKLYEKILGNGIVGAAEVAKQLNISRTSVYDLLKKLIDAGLIYETFRDGAKKFVPQKPEVINLLLEEKLKTLNESKTDLLRLHDASQHVRQSLGPHLQVFQGRAALQQMMKDMLLYRDIEVLTLWPAKVAIKLLTNKFWQKFQAERVTRNISLRVIWPEKQIVPTAKFPYLASNPEFKREVRITPKKVDYSLGYSIYGNTTRFISSQRDSFGYLIENQEMAEMMKSQFELIWQISRPVK
jgi:sugar-specific transcriptional regulator TrmB